MTQTSKQLKIGRKKLEKNIHYFFEKGISVKC
jgi:hypothetical protein